MTLLSKPSVAILFGAVLVAALAGLAAFLNASQMAAGLEARAAEAIAAAGGAPVKADFTYPYGWPTRHPLLSGGETLDEATRDKVAKAVAAIPGVGGIRWADGTARAENALAAAEPVHCEEDVDALL